MKAHQLIRGDNIFLKIRSKIILEIYIQAGKCRNISFNLPKLYLSKIS